MSAKNYKAGAYLRRAEDDKENYAEDEEERREAEDDEKDVNAEDEHDENCEDGEDKDIDAEDEEERREAEDDDDKKPETRKSRIARVKERRRCSSLMRVSAQARTMGVKFDAEKAIINGMSANEARKSVLAAAARADKALKVSTVRKSSSAFGHSREAKRDMWRAARQKMRRR